MPKILFSKEGCAQGKPPTTKYLILILEIVIQIRIFLVEKVHLHRKDIRMLVLQLFVRKEEMLLDLMGKCIQKQMQMPQKR